MGDRIPVNFFGKGSDTTQNKRHYCYGKQSRIFDFVDDGTGLIDLYTEDAIQQAIKNKKELKRALWISESKAFRKKLFKLIETERERLFEELKLDYIITYEAELARQDDRFKHIKGCGHWVKLPAIYKKTNLL